MQWGCVVSSSSAREQTGGGIAGSKTAARCLGRAAALHTLLAAAAAGDQTGLGWEPFLAAAVGVEAAASQTAAEASAGATVGV